MAYCWGARWEGRPKTPPFQWGAAGEVVPPHDQWLKDFDCSFWGLDKLVEPALLQQNPNFLERDLKETKDVFLQWAGALQAVFTIYQLQVRCAGCSPCCACVSDLVIKSAQKFVDLMF